MGQKDEWMRQVFWVMAALQEYWAATPGWPLRLLVCVSAFGAAYLFSRLVRFKLAPWAVRRAERGHSKMLRVLVRGFAHPAPVVVWVLGLYFAVLALPLPPAWLAGLAPWMNKLLRITLICLLAWGLTGSSDIAPLMMKNVQGKLDVEMDRTVAAFVNKILRVVVICFALVMVLGELGYNVNGLITGMGLAGLTVSLAAQDSAANFFAGLVIILEKPFRLGDWIITPQAEGTVEDISFRSTKVRTLDGSLMVLPNSVLCAEAINNGSQRRMRLYRFTIGVTYDTPKDKIELLMARLRALLAADEQVDAPSALVRLQGFGASSIDILVSCNLLTPAWDAAMAVQERLNLAILDLMQELGVSFAFPSQSLYIEQTPPPPKPAQPPQPGQPPKSGQRAAKSGWPPANPS